MPRADLHYALAVDREIYEASRVDPSLLDPVVRVDGGLPGTARPFAVIRDYQGPQGFYVEHFLLSDRRGRELTRSRTRRIRLEGEMSEDRFVSVLTDVSFSDGDEHQLTFFLNDEEVGAVPVFVEVGLGGDPATAVEHSFRAALQKGTIVWLTVPQADGRSHEQPVWFVYMDDRVYVFSGPTEQQVPNLDRVAEVEIIARSKDVRSRICRVPASVRLVPHDDDLFAKVAQAGLAKRLNLPDLGDAALERWKTNLTLVELVPRFRDQEPQERTVAPAAPAAVEQPAESAVAATAPGPDRARQEEPHVEAQIDQTVFDRLVAEGASERVARAKAKAAYVRAEKARLRAEREKAVS
ncbi:MAG: hypothetical protein M3N52_07210 [Actinomycetota bacterium]|nr:hypothetical protein [Actinomycetota bacterium]